MFIFYDTARFSTLDKLAQALGVRICDLIDDTPGETGEGKI